MNWVAAHETGHIFLAADQYYQAGYGGCLNTTDRYGYLGVANSNCENGNPGSVPSIMRSNEDALDVTASGQIGWRDSNVNGVLDPIDTNPAFNLPAYSPDPSTQSRLTYTGHVYDIPWPHASCNSWDSCYSKDVDINKVSSVQYRVDGGTWVPIPASDGTYDSDYEAITFTTGIFNNGLHSIEVNATNSIGRSASWTDTVTVNYPYPLTVSKTGAGTGTVTSSPAGINCGLTCSANFETSASVTLTAAAGGNSAFTGWSGAGCSGIGTCTVTMNAARSITANFGSNPTCYTLTLSPGTGGSITTNPNPNCNNGSQYSQGVVVSLSAVPASGLYYFINWGGDVSGASTPVDVSMGQNRSVTANFGAVTFADVPTSTWYWKWVEGFYAQGITSGCALNPLRYCPGRSVTRAETAVFLLRSMNGASYVPAPPTTGIFTDVPVAGKEWMQAWIEQFYADGITSGCNASPLRYCPERQVTRAEMAVFVLRAVHGISYTPPAVTGIFADVPVAGKEWMQAWIEQFYREGITTGCATAPLRYCPEQNVTRAEVATFIDRAFGFPQLP
jgi:hypothetical protein